METDTVTANKSGSTVLSTKAFGRSHLPTEEGDRSMLTGMFMMGIGCLIWLKVMALISIMMALGMMEVGFRINNMGMEKSIGQMAVITKECILMVKNMDKGNFYGLMGVIMKGSLRRMALMDSGFSNGKMGGIILVIGFTIKCLDMGNLCGLMGRLMRAGI